MLCAPVLLLVRLTLSSFGSYVAVTPAAEELMRVRMLLRLSVLAQLMDTAIDLKCATRLDGPADEPGLC